MILTPDGVRYFAASERPVPRPFHLRWLLPKVLGTNRVAWRACTYLSVAAVGLLSWAYTGSPWMVSLALLPSFLFTLRHPVLVDAPAFALALASGVVWPHNEAAAVALAVAAACVRESAPVWAAIYAWSPWPLLGLVVVTVRWGMRTGPDPAGYDADLAHPLRSSLKYHRGQWLDPMLMVAPWGPMLVGLAAMSPQLGVALAAAYGQLLIATDSVRLYQWAAPVLALGVVAVVPPAWLPLVALGIVFNPWKGDGL